MDAFLHVLCRIENGKDNMVPCISFYLAGLSLKKILMTKTFRLWEVKCKGTSVKEDRLYLCARHLLLKVILSQSSVFRLQLPPLRLASKFMQQHELRQVAKPSVELIEY